MYVYMLFAGWEVRIVKNCDREVLKILPEGSIFKSEVTVFYYRIYSNKRRPRISAAPKTRKFK